MELTWRQMRKIHSPMELYKIILREYMKEKCYKTVAKKFCTNYEVIKNFLDRYCNYLDEEGKELLAEVQKIKASKKNEYLTKEEKLKNKCNTILEEVPKKVTYDEFINLISHYTRVELSTNEWLNLAKDKKIEVIYN